MNVTQNDRLKQVAFDFLIAGEDSGSLQIDQAFLCKINKEV